jgi:ATP-dependent DNA helicase DinG
LQDRGLLVLLDNRVLKKSYGRVFLNSLPPYQQTTNIADVERFFGVPQSGEGL